MKNLRTNLLCACMALYSITAVGQQAPVNEPNYNKPKLFASVPEKIPVNINLLDGLLNSQTGAIVNIVVSPAFQFKGQVTSSVSKYENTIRSVVIRSSNYNGATLSFSRITNTQSESVVYEARIVSMAHGDLYELKNENGQYSFVKKNFYDLINE